MAILVKIYTFYYVITQINMSFHSFSFMKPIEKPFLVRHFEVVYFCVHYGAAANCEVSRQAHMI